MFRITLYVAGSFPRHLRNRPGDLGVDQVEAAKEGTYLPRYTSPWERQSFRARKSGVHR